jgi:fatty acid desaturase
MRRGAPPRDGNLRYIVGAMRRTRAITLLLSAVVALLALAPSALAITHGGQGLYGETDDVVVTNMMFGVIIFFVVIIIVFSLIQSWLDHRKHARMDAAARRAASVDWRGGW